MCNSSGTNQNMQIRILPIISFQVVLNHFVAEKYIEDNSKRSQVDDSDSQSLL